MKLGTLRNPGADLSRLPVGLDLRAISIAEGVRAALAIAVVILADDWLGWPPLVYMALAANLTCFCDVGGPIRPRVAALLSFTVLGALMWSGFGLLRPLGLPLVVPLACLVIFANCLVRVWGLGAQAVGNLLTVVVVLALDRPLGLPQAGMVAAMFLAGGLWATLLTMVVWRLHPYRPARVDVAEVWRLLAEAADDQRRLLRRADASPADWDDHALAHRRAIRAAIEQARVTVMELARMRGPLSLRGAQALIRLEAADQLYGALIALSDLLEVAGPARRAAADELLRALGPLLAVIARSILADSLDRLPRLDRAIARILARSEADPLLHAITEAIADRLRIAIRIAAPVGYLSGSELPGEPAPPLVEQFWGPIAANLTWRSAMLRHAARATAVAAPALVVTLVWEGSFTHWLTITVVLTMQPFYAATWQRALERTAGTVLGGLVGAGLAMLARTPTAFVVLMFPLSVIGFAARRVSYGAFIACLTPQLVVLVELLEPTHSSWEIAGMRALFTVMGGVIALAGNLLLWPSWEPDRLRQELRGALAAHGIYAVAALGRILGEAGEATERARRDAGVASNNLETSLARALQEPRRSQRPRLEAAMLAASTLRRIVGALSALYHDPSSAGAMAPESWRQWRDWIGAAMAALAEGRSPPLRPAPAAIEPLARVGRQMEMLEGALSRFW